MSNTVVIGDQHYSFVVDKCPKDVNPKIVDAIERLGKIAEELNVKWVLTGDYIGGKDGSTAICSTRGDH